MRTEAPFTADFYLDRKAEVQTTQDGDIIIEGLAADWLWDRQQEMFEPGAFEDGLKSFLATNPILTYHHQYDKALGQVLAADVRPDGLWVKARVDKPAAGSWAEDVYEKIKRGTIRGFSVGGSFKRRDGKGGPRVGQPGRIYEVDFAELSVTPLPINPRTMFEVAGKAFENAEQTDERSQIVRTVQDYVGEKLERITGLLNSAEAKATTRKEAGEATPGAGED